MGNRVVSEGACWNIRPGPIHSIYSKDCAMVRTCINSASSLVISWFRCFNRCENGFSIFRLRAMSLFLLMDLINLVSSIASRMLVDRRSFEVNSIRGDLFIKPSSATVRPSVPRRGPPGIFSKNVLTFSSYKLVKV